MKTHGLTGMVALGLSLSLPACGGGDERGMGTDAGESGTTLTTTDDGGSDDAQEGNDDGAKLDTPDDGGDTAGDEGGFVCDESDKPEADATITGTVYAPNGEIPLSGALVYVANNEDQVISTPQDGVYCDECVQLPCHHFTFTEPDGSFELDVASGTDQRLVVQKGQFMRVTEFEIDGGDTVAIDPAVTTMPDAWNPSAGEYIPKIAVALGPYDTVEEVLAKMGLGEVTAAGEVMYGEENRSIDFYARTPDFETQYGGILGEGLELFQDIDLMDQYHIIFVPCGSELEMETAVGLGFLEPDVTENIRDWVARGGKLYVSDDANEYLYQPFDPYQEFWVINGSPDIQAYDSLATILDSDLEAWLNALPAPLKNIGQGQPTLDTLPQVLVEGAWSAIMQVFPVEVEDDEGMTVDVGHKVWVEGPQGGGVPANTEGPLTITGDYGCGKIMYSNYHTADDTHTGLAPQELILLYLILEIGVCADNPAPPPPVD